MKLVTLSVDSVDSLHAGCTTHFVSLLLYELRDKVKLADLPLLVRLNPAIPWKTRGNASVALRMYYDGSLEELLRRVEELANAYSGKKDYGVIVASGAIWKDLELRRFYERTLTSVIPLDVATELVEKKKLLWSGGRGTIGALAALTALNENDDYTFELIAYRKPEAWGTKRCVVEGIKVALLEGDLPPCVFNNYDPLTGELTASPKGYDPVLAGFRGDCYELLPEYSKLLCEEPDLWTLFRSNQHTDVHARPLKERLYPYESGYVRGVVSENPEVIPGSHTVVEIETEEGVVDVVFYRETFPLNKIAAMLGRGDEIVVYGSVRPYKPRGKVVIASAKLVVEKISKRVLFVNPRCPLCGHRFESVGAGKGYRCKSCGYTINKMIKVEIEKRSLLSPAVYTPRPGRLRHLVAPPLRKPKHGFGLPLNPLSVESVIGRTPPIPRLF
ncbi:MAG: tRNA(Ile)(2)-agmatinylcytidine synthase [Acidilobaceae archaeon]